MLAHDIDKGGLMTRQPRTEVVVTSWRLVPPAAPKAARKKRPSLKEMNDWMARNRKARHRLEAENTRENLGTPAY